METANIGISAKDFRLKTDGCPHNPKDFMDVLIMLDKLSEFDNELSHIVQKKATDELQQLFKKRYARCHCGSVSRFHLFLEYFHEEVHCCCKKGEIKADIATHLKQSPAFSSQFYDMPDLYKRVVKLNVDIEVNGIPVKAAVHSGSYSTIISSRKAKEFGDGGFESLECGRKCREFSITIGKTTYNPCWILVDDLDSTNSECILGLDMLRNFKCIIDLKKMVLEVGDGTVDIHLEEESSPILVEVEAEDETSRTARLLHKWTPNYSVAASCKNGFNQDGYAKDPVAFRECIRKNHVLMAKLFQFPNLAAAVLGDDINVLQKELRGLRCVCDRCLELFLVQHFEEYKRFQDNCKFAREHHRFVTSAEDNRIDMPHVRMIAGYGYSSEALVDSGAQSTIMSKSLSEQFGLLQHLDDCYEMCDGRESKIVGKVDCSFIKIDKNFHHCPTIIVDTTYVNMVFGLDMLLKLKCTIDFKNNVLKVGDDEKAPVVFKQGKYLDYDCENIFSRETCKHAFSYGLYPAEANEVKILVLEKILDFPKETVERMLADSNWDMNAAMESLKVDPFEGLNETAIRQDYEGYDDYSYGDDDDDDDCYWQR